ncbi:hypothetical protein SSX86_006412 [Deinandra increscens subsp. villosa]|uniref:Major facilitator superfamily (MFS) profile domain-containing protein n=1 Tax=Deinandra increscens subsp. villosa TaxID=3103831 RepID=A0AAP0DIT9_9ASTR
MTGLANDRADQYEGKVTAYVIIACIVAAVGGSIFGYDTGISGGVTSMDAFLLKFFPTVYEKKRRSRENNYCKFNDQGLAAFTSSLYLAGLFATLFASPVTRNYGRRISIICGGVSFLVGAALNAAAVNFAMLLLGRIMFGVGIGFGNQAIPLYLSEMAPTHIRGGLNMMFQLATTLGIFSANMINFGTSNIDLWGWRLSLGLAAGPALLMTVGGIFLPETPNSLIEQGSKEKGRKVLERIRGTQKVDAEFEDMVDASELANSIKHPEADGSVEFGDEDETAYLFDPDIYTDERISVQWIDGVQTVDGRLLAIALEREGKSMFGEIEVREKEKEIRGRRSGRLVWRWPKEFPARSFWLKVTVGIILGLKFGDDQQLSEGYSVVIVVIICLFVAAFGWSWGPLGWTVPSEIFPLETRSAGQSITVAVNLFVTFIIAQSFLSLLCVLKFGLFLFFAGWIIVMTMFVYIFLPETKGVPIEEMMLMWQRHWFWKKIILENP